VENWFRIDWLLLWRIAVLLGLWRGIDRLRNIQTLLEGEVMKLELERDAERYDG
jgi:hypothetical protein